MKFTVVMDRNNNCKNRCSYKILLTGATGFLGSNILKALLKNEYGVCVIKRSFSDIRRIEKLIKEIKYVDIDKEPLNAAFELYGPFDFILHTATNYGHESTSQEIYNDNFNFPLRLIEMGIQYNTNAFINTDTFYRKFIDSSLHMKDYVNSKFKFFEEGLLLSKNKIMFINITLEHIYGTGDNDNKFIPWVISKIADNTSSIMLTQGLQKRDFIYIDDVVDAYKYVLEYVTLSSAGFYNFEIGAGESVPLKELIITIKDILSSETDLLFGAKPYRKNEIMESKADISSLLKMGWHPKITLYDGLVKCINYYQNRKR